MQECWNNKKIRYLEASNPDFCRRRRNIVILAAFRAFLLGVQYTIVFPSLWPYLESFGASQWFYGLTSAIYQISAILFLPIIGKVYDYTWRLKEITIALNILDIIGNILYSLPFSVWLPFFSRLLLGIASTLPAATISEVALITHSEDKLSTMASFQLGMFMGTISGPAFSYLFAKLDIQLGRLTIDFRNAPGVFCALIWSVLLVLAFILVSNTAKDFKSDVIVETPENRVSSVSVTEDEPSEEGYLLISEKLQDGDQCQGIKAKEYHETRTKEKKESFLQSLSVLFAWEIMSIHFATFLLSLALYFTETLTPLVAEEDLGWSTTMTGVLLASATFFALVSSALLKVCGRKISEMSLIYVGLAALCITSIFFIFYQIERTHHTTAAILYVTGFEISFFCFPFELIASRSLLSKIVPNHSQGLIQSIASMRRRIAGLVGPFIGVFMYHSMIIGSVSIMFFCCLGVLLLRFSSNKLEMRIQRYSTNE